jgi:NAD(P)H-nitrite reductase large subunit
MVKPDGSDARTFVIIGGGAAGHTCAETLRKNGFKGRIVVLSQENASPYDRVLLSKNVKSDASAFAFRTPEFYQEFGIDLHLGTTVQAIDPTSKTVKTASGDSFVRTI